MSISRLISFLRFLFLYATFIRVAGAQVNPGPIQWRYVGYAETEEWWLEYETLPGWNYIIEQSQNLETWEPMPGGFAYGDGGVKRQFITHGPVPPEPGSQPPPQSSGPAPPPKTVLSFNWTVTLSADPASPTVHVKREADLPDYPAWDTVLDLPLPRPSSTRICFLLDYEDESHFYWNTPTVRIATTQNPQPTDTLPSAGEQEEAELAVFQGIVNQLTAYLSHDQANPNLPDPVPGPHNYVRIRRLLADSNRNGIPDWQELRYGFPVLTEGIDPNDDWDGDGILNAVEFATGTNPRIADAAPVHLFSAWHSASLHQCVLTESPSTPVNSETASNGQHSYSGNGPGTVTPATLNSELDAIWTRAGAQVAGNAPFSPFDVGTSSLTAFVNGQYSSGSTSSAFSTYGSSFVSILDGATMRYRIRLHSLRPPPVPVNRHFLTILRKQPNGWNIGNTPPPAAGWHYTQEAMVTRSLQPAAPGAPPAAVSSAEANIFRPAIDVIPDGKQMRNERTLAEVSLRADTSRNGTIDASDYHTHQPAVYIVNYDHDQRRTHETSVSTPVEDAVKWVNRTPTIEGHDLRYPDGETQTQIKAEHEDWDLEHGGIEPENPAQLAPLRIAPIAFAKPDMKVILRLPAPTTTSDPVSQKYKAFHLYIVTYIKIGSNPPAKRHVPIWGGISATAPPSVTLGSEVDISQYVNPQAPGYTDTRPAPSSANPYPAYEFVLEGILFKGMPYPDENGTATYGPSSNPNPVFDGVLQLGLEFRAGNPPAAIGGKTSWATLTCAPSLNFTSHADGYLIPAAPSEPLLAFKGNTPETTAHGYGKYALGGRYGHVFTVTNNGDSPTNRGSLRYAINSPVPRTIVFALDGVDQTPNDRGGAGTISLNSPLLIRDRQCTIAGQTAYRNGSDGVCLESYGLRIDTDDVIVRYLRSRPGREGTTLADGAVDAIVIEGVSSDILLDHCTTSFSSDTLIDVITGKDRVTKVSFTRHGRHLTVQNCLLSWPLDHYNHWEDDNPKNGIQDGPIAEPIEDHGYGGMVRMGYGGHATFWRNLYAHCRGRCPRPGALVRNQDDPLGLRLDFVNNVIFAWGDKGSAREGTSAGWDEDGNIPGTDDPYGFYNFVGNYYRARLEGDWGQKGFFRTNNSKARAWFSGNRIKIGLNHGPATPADQYADQFIQYNQPASRATFALYNMIGNAGYSPPILAAESVEQSVRKQAGAILKRDRLEIRLLGTDGLGGEYRGPSGTIIDHPDQVGGWPELHVTTPPADEDRDGLPNERDLPESHLKTDPRNSAADDDKDGYTNLEEYLNEITN